VTGSHPDMVAKPFVLQPVLWPLVMSFSADAPVEYRNGLRNPSGLLPAAIRRSLRREMTEAKMGEEQLVPATSSVLPPTTISTFWPCAATSGKPRPVRLKRPLLVLPRRLR
jgi:hypothetical protein